MDVKDRSFGYRSFDRSEKASPVEMAYIQNVDRKLRPLGIPVTKDRVLQAAVLLMTEPVFEDSSCGFLFVLRPVIYQRTA